MHAIGATEEITLVELDADPQEENQEVQHQEVPNEGELEVDHLPECLDHRPTSFLKGKPRSILSLPIFYKIILESFMFDALGYKSWLEILDA